MHTERMPPPARFNFARHILAVNSGRHGKLAYRDDKTKLSYGELDQRVRRFAAGLLKQGVQPEQRVLLVMHVAPRGRLFAYQDGGRGCSWADGEAKCCWGDLT